VEAEGTTLECGEWLLRWKKSRRKRIWFLGDAKPKASPDEGLGVPGKRLLREVVSVVDLDSRPQERLREAIDTQEDAEYRPYGDLVLAVF